MEQFSLSAQEQPANTPVLLVRGLLDPAGPAARRAQLRDDPGNSLGRQPGFAGDLDLGAALPGGDTPENGVAGQRGFTLADYAQRLGKGMRHENCELSF